MSNFKNLSNTMKPREKFLIYGGEHLADYELLAIILGTGSQKDSVNILAQKLIEKYGGLSNLSNQSIEELCQNRGIGKSKAIRIKSIYFLQKKIIEENSNQITIIKKAKDIYRFMKKHAYDEAENLYVICLDVKNTIISYKCIFKGSIASVSISPREIFKYALEQNSKKICLVHNHPSGDPSPSKGDINSTQLLIAAAEMVEIEIIDHIIIAKNKFCSIKSKCDIIF